MLMGTHTYPQSVHSGSFKLVSVVELLIFSDRLSTAELLFLTQAFTRMRFIGQKILQLLAVIMTE